MKKNEMILAVIIIVGITLLMLTALGQNNDDRNQRILNYVDKSVGHKIGKEHCRYLVESALTVTNSCLDLDSMISPSNVMAGNIVQMDFVVDNDGIIGEKKTIWGIRQYMLVTDNHVAIIYDVLGDGRYIIAEQSKGEPVALREIDTRKIMFGQYIYLRAIPCTGRVRRDRGVGKLRPKLCWKPIAHIRAPREVD